MMVPNFSCEPREDEDDAEEEELDWRNRDMKRRGWVV